MESSRANNEMVNATRSESNTKTQWQEGDGPFRARCTLVRKAAARAVDAAVDGGPPADGGFDGGWLISRASLRLRLV